MSCWQLVRDFHDFYQRVANAHHVNIDTKPIELDDDPLPHDISGEEQMPVVESAGQLVNALGDDFFESGWLFCYYVLV